MFTLVLPHVHVHNSLSRVFRSYARVTENLSTCHETADTVTAGNHAG